MCLLLTIFQVKLLFRKSKFYSRLAKLPKLFVNLFFIKKIFYLCHSDFGFFFNHLYSYLWRFKIINISI